jgi:hypothetical protein
MIKGITKEWKHVGSLPKKFRVQKPSRKSLRFHLLGYPDLAQSGYYLFSKLKKDLYQKIVIDALETLFVDLENDAKS